ncbi:ABC transporter permease [Actinomadura craniellae]|uniref:ABC transporter permease n=1 Tax=Actinomadura craniellae TaxID=2231787 RepID=A0A365H824_9ACTN|nr:ABC transporter permease [Actinomadura craniellae]RAY15116.1 ABC transporter permease [Actinomadura craniellae]
MNATIAAITLRAMLGRRRALLLFALPALPILLAVILRMTGDNDLGTSAGVLQSLVLGTLLPLLCLIAGTGVIGPEIDDGQIMYILTKPIPRPVITTTKLVVAFGLAVVFAVIPTLLTGLLLTGTFSGLTAGFTAGALVGAAAYCAIFVALAVISRNAVTIGLIYALVWESLIGNLASGARSASVQQWALSVADAVADTDRITPAVSLPVAVVLLVVVVAGGAFLAGGRLGTLTAATAD